MSGGGTGVSGALGVGELISDRETGTYIDPQAALPDDCLSHQTCQLRLSHTHFIIIFLPQLKACNVLPWMGFPCRQMEDISLNKAHILSRP